MICGTRNRGYLIPYLVNETSGVELVCFKNAKIFLFSDNNIEPIYF